MTRYILLLLSIISYASSFASPFTHWHCIDIMKNVDKSKPYAYNIGELPLVTWFNDSKPITTLNICKHMGSKLHEGHVSNDGCLSCPYHGIKHSASDTFGQTIVFEDKLWWSYNAVSKTPPVTPFWKNKNYNTIMFTMLMNANIQDCIFNTLDINHFAYIHDNLFGKKLPPVEYNYQKLKNKLIMHYKYNMNTNIELLKSGQKNFHNFQIFSFPFTSTAILSLNDKERLVINLNLRPIEPNKTMWVVTLKHNFWKSYFAKVKLDLIMKYILHQDQTQMSKQASDNMLKKSMFYKLKLKNEDHFQELVKMFRAYEYPDMISVMRLYNYHNHHKSLL